MRVSAAAWTSDKMEEVRRLARLSAEVAHNHPEGNKGVEAVHSFYLAKSIKTSYFTLKSLYSRFFEKVLAQGFVRV